jgi:hypothetical protein
MAHDSEETSKPNINVINIAIDDAMWVLETDHDELLQVLADPVTWVKTNVKFNQTPAVLSQPFVVVFHHVPPQGDTPTIKVQGLHETAVMIVKLSKPLTASKVPGTIFPQGEYLDVLQVGKSIHTHLHLSGFSKLQVAQHLLTSVTDQETYFAALNQLPQRQKGVITPEADKKVFKIDPNVPPHVTYQGWAPKLVPASGMKGGSDDPTDEDCTMANGDANELGQVIVNGVIVKTYAIGG